MVGGWSVRGAERREPFGDVNAHDTGPRLTIRPLEPYLALAEEMGGAVAMQIGFGAPGVVDYGGAFPRQNYPRL